MELNGICCDSKILDDMGVDIKERVDVITKEIYQIKYNTQYYSHKSTNAIHLFLSSGNHY